MLYNQIMYPPRKDLMRKYNTEVIRLINCLKKKGRDHQKSLRYLYIMLEKVRLNRNPQCGCTIQAIVGYTWLHTIATYSYYTWVKTEHHTENSDGLREAFVLYNNVSLLTKTPMK